MVVFATGGSVVAYSESSLGRSSRFAEGAILPRFLLLRFFFLVVFHSPSSAGERVLQRLELVGLDFDPRPIRRLEQLGLGRGDAVPPQRVQVGREQRGIIEPPPGDHVPRRRAEHLGVDLPLPQHLERLALGVVGQARQPHQGVVPVLGRGHDLFHEVLA